ncbi:ATP-binding cassette domain-containing protein [Saccharopolyspora sp. NFXS83]|uniref:ABC transporter ATP-binding protein n=1 Tax=Saccharopolyspora sp. NFXS83 TaxID=2993560 RepID=UPI00224B0A32|nr:ATP-binding cassette domain-containing protein [Saccharopolyspora sp. NFXS83]MCX2731518.1 ATP-binding cassette domain-containing protein [Saccharopolyspora sp. NFXS83]
MPGRCPTRSGGLIADGISKEFGVPGRPVLRGVDLRASPGHCTSVLGPAGSGKSVLLRCLAGLERPTHGTVRIAGTDLGTLDEAARTEFRRERIGIVYPQGNLLPVLTVLDNLLLPLDTAGRRADPELLDRALDALDVRELLGRSSQSLTRAEQQRVALARAVVQQADLLLADEPTAGLDAVNGRHLLRLLRRCCNEFGLPVVLLSTDPAAAAYADRLIALHDGRVVQDKERPGDCWCEPREARAEHIA